jgi:hypothetical protein
MNRTIAHTIRVVASLLRRDVRDLFKGDGKIVDDGFLRTLGKALQEAGLGQELADEVVAEVRLASFGRVIQEDTVIKFIKPRLRATFG